MDTIDRLEEWKRGRKVAEVCDIKRQGMETK